MQAQAAKRNFGRRYLIAAVALAILLAVAVAALVVADVVDRSGATAPEPERELTNPPDAQRMPEKPRAYWNPKMGEGLIAGQYPDIQEAAGAYVLPEEAVDAQLRLDRPEAYYSTGQGEGLIDGQRQHDVGVERAIDAQRMQFLEQNLYLSGDADTTSEIQRLQQLYWELEAPRAPASSTAPYDYRKWTAGQWTEGLTDR